MLHRAAGQTTYVLVFASGDRVMEGLTGFAARAGVSAAHFSAIGAFQAAEPGYFDVGRSDYRRIPLAEQLEVVSMAGNVARDEQDHPRVHAHVVLGGPDGRTWGGHLLEATVRPTLELVLVESPPYLRRRHRPEVGLALIDPGAPAATRGGLT